MEFVNAKRLIQRFKFRNITIYEYQAQDQAPLVKTRASLSRLKPEVMQFRNIAIQLNY